MSCATSAEFSAGQTLSGSAWAMGKGAIPASLKGLDRSLFADPKQTVDAEIDLIDQCQILVPFGVLDYHFRPRSSEHDCAVRAVAKLGVNALPRLIGGMRIHAILTRKKFCRRNLFGSAQRSFLVFRDARFKRSHYILNGEGAAEEANQEPAFRPTGHDTSRSLSTKRRPSGAAETKAGRMIHRSKRRDSASH